MKDLTEKEMDLILQIRSKFLNNFNYLKTGEPRPPGSIIELEYLVAERKFNAIVELLEAIDTI